VLGYLASRGCRVFEAERTTGRDTSQVTSQLALQDACGMAKEARVLGCHQRMTRMQGLASAKPSEPIGIYLTIHNPLGRRRDELELILNSLIENATTFPFFNAAVYMTSFPKGPSHTDFVIM